MNNLSRADLILYGLFSPFFRSYRNILHIAVTGVKLSSEASLRLMDMQGRIILQQALSNQTELQLNLLPSGVYLLEAKDGHAVWRERVVVTQ